jgi:hypothetical protein
VPAALVAGVAARSLADGADSTTARAAAGAKAPNWVEVTHITPPPQPPLAIIGEQGIGPIRDAFNRGDGQTRIVMLMSPT